MTKRVLSTGMTVLALSLGLTACSLAPQYERPQTTVPEKFGSQTKTTYDAASGSFSAQSIEASKLAEGSDVSAATPWRQFFQDPQLVELIDIALKNNRNLQAAIARMDQAQAMWGVQRGEMFPTMGAGIQGTRQMGPSPTGSGSNVISSQYSAGIAMTAFEVDLFGRLRNLSEAAYQQYLASAEGARAVQIALVADTAIQYYRYRMANAMRDLTRETYESRKKTYDLVNARFKSGVASERDAVQAKSLVDAAAADLARFTRDSELALNALAVLLGQPLPKDLPAAQPFDAKHQVKTIPVGLTSELLVRRPDIRAAENQLLAANANIGAARAAFFPNISLTGNYGTASTSLGGLFKDGSGAWAFSPVISVPLFTGGSLQAGLEAANAAQREAVARYQQSIEQAFREVSDALAGEATYSSQLQARTAQSEAAKRYYDLSNARFFNGIDSFLDVQIAQVDLFTARLQEVQTGFELLANRVNLYKALGGGWDDSVPGSTFVQSPQTGGTLADPEPADPPAAVAPATEQGKKELTAAVQATVG